MLHSWIRQASLKGVFVLYFIRYQSNTAKKCLDASAGRRDVGETAKINDYIPHEVKHCNIDRCG